MKMKDLIFPKVQKIHKKNHFSVLLPEKTFTFYILNISCKINLISKCSIMIHDILQINIQGYNN